MVWLNVLGRNRARKIFSISIYDDPDSTIQIVAIYFIEISNFDVNVRFNFQVLCSLSLQFGTACGITSTLASCRCARRERNCFTNFDCAHIGMFLLRLFAAEQHIGRIPSQRVIVVESFWLPARLSSEILEWPRITRPIYHRESTELDCSAEAIVWIRRNLVENPNLNWNSERFNQLSTLPVRRLKALLGVKSAHSSCVLLQRSHKLASDVIYSDEQPDIENMKRNLLFQYSDQIVCYEGNIQKGNQTFIGDRCRDLTGITFHERNGISQFPIMSCFRKLWPWRSSG
jgi:hypothetical protein